MESAARESVCLIMFQNKLFERGAKMNIRIDYNNNGRHETCFDVLSFRVGYVTDTMGENRLCLIIQYENHSVQYKYDVECIKNIGLFMKG